MLSLTAGAGHLTARRKRAVIDNTAGPIWDRPAPLLTSATRMTADFDGEEDCDAPYNFADVKCDVDEKNRRCVPLSAPAAAMTHKSCAKRSWSLLLVLLKGVDFGECSVGNRRMPVFNWLLLLLKTNT